MRELTIGETDTCKHCGKELIVADGGVMGYYWYHVETDSVACYPVPGVFVRRPRACPLDDDEVVF